jgi:tetratricopeptide (TPR) repeat protein
MKTFLAIHFLFFSFLFSCSTIKPVNESDRVRTEVAKHFSTIKKAIAAKKYAIALQKIKQMVDKGLRPNELATKYNLWGMLNFKQKRFEDANKYFTKGLDAKPSNNVLEAQIRLNLSSGHFKLSNYQRSFEEIENIQFELLKEKNFRKLFFLRYVLSRQLNRKNEVVNSLIYLLSPEKDRKELIENKYYKNATRYFSLLDYENKVAVLKKFEETNYMVVAHLAIHLAMDLKRLEQFEKSDEILFWVKRHFTDYGFSIEKYLDQQIVSEPINPNRIGVVLPLTGNRSKFGQKVLLGISLANSGLEKPFELLIRDSQGSPQVATYQIQDLVKNNQVAMVMGGLFSESAGKQYLAAERLGASFVSFSPIYLSKKRKSNLLIELPGSVESQVSSLFKQVGQGHLGKRFALLYPDDSFGRTYLDSFWNHFDKEDGDYQLISVSKFERNITDYREPVKNLVGLKFNRERQEEYQKWLEIYKLKVRNTKRIQILRPEVHFDWVFIPSFPQEVVQIIPAFQYADVKNLPFVGGPSWMSSKLVTRARSLGKMFFVGDLDQTKIDKIKQRFINTYGQEPKLLESLGFDSIFLANHLLEKANFSNRSGFINFLKEKSSLKSYLSIWKKQEQLWVKDMDLFKINKSGVEMVSN